MTSTWPPSASPPGRAPHRTTALAALFVVACGGGTDDDGRTAGGADAAAVDSAAASDADRASPPRRAPAEAGNGEDAERLLVYGCGRLSVTLRFGGDDGADSAELLLPDRVVTLRRVPGGSGTRYEGGGVTFRSKGEEARLELPGRVFPDCVRDRPAESFAAARLRGVRFRALGQEPGWILDIVPEDSRMRLEADYGELDVTTPLPEPEIDRDAGTRRYEAVTESHRLSVLIETRECHDAMSGFAFPRSVTLTLDDRTLEGCGRPLGPGFTGRWRLAGFGAPDPAGPVPGTRPRLELDAWGRVSVDTGCDGLSGRWTSSGPGALRFGALARTKMACPPPRSAPEERVAAALAATRGYTLLVDTLRLTGAAGEPLAVFHRDGDLGS